MARKGTQTSTDTSGSYKRPLKLSIAVWIARVALCAVFAVNLWCILGFLFTPEKFVGVYELSGTPGMVAIRGFGVAFLMWNVTYPFAIANPLRFNVVYIIVLVQQLVGLIGESFICMTIGAGHELLASNILRFIIFDGAGLVCMLAAYLWLRICVYSGKINAEN